MHPRLKLMLTAITLCVIGTGLWAEPITNTIPYSQNFEGYDLDSVFLSDAVTVGNADGWYALGAPGEAFAKIVSNQWSSAYTNVLNLMEGGIENRFENTQAQKEIFIDLMVRAVPSTETDAESEIDAFTQFAAFVDEDGYLNVRHLTNGIPTWTPITEDPVEATEWFRLRVDMEYDVNGTNYFAVSTNGTDLINNALGATKPGLADANGAWLVSASSSNKYFSAVGLRGYTFVDNVVVTNKTILTLEDIAIEARPYDATTDATVTSYGALSGVASGDDVSLVVSEANATFTDPNAGVGIEVLVTGLSLAGANANNYVIYDQTAYGNITAKELTVDGAMANDKDYDGTDTATVNFDAATLNGVVVPEDVTLDTAAYTATFVNKNVGTWDVTVSGLGLAGTANLNNYSLTQPTLSADISTVPLTVTAEDKSKDYDGDVFPFGSFTVSYDGFVDGENESVLGGTLNFVGAAITAVNAGDYVITPEGLTSGNYDISYENGELTINTVPLTVTAEDKSKDYDGDIFPFGSFTVTYGGFVGNDNESDLSGTLNFVGTAIAAFNAGDYVITPEGLTSGNYDISFANGELTINTVPLTVTADDKTKVYDGEVFPVDDYTVSYDGFVDGETESVLDGTLAFVGTAITAVNVGDYVITPVGLTSGNYDITPEDGTLSITIATPTVDPWPTASDIIDGQALSDSDLTGGVVEYLGESVDGLFTFDDPALVPTVGPDFYDVTFTPTDSNNFNSVSGTVEVNVRALEAWVDPSFDEGTLGWGVYRFASIQTAIVAVAVGADIDVAAGVYAESIDVNQAGITLSTDDAAEIVGSGDAVPTLKVSGEGVTVEGFKVVLDIDHTEGVNAIEVDADDVILANLDVDKAPILDVAVVINEGAALLLAQGTTGFTFTNSIVNSAWNGVIVQSEAADIVLADNTLTGTGLAGDIGIQLVWLTGESSIGPVTIENNDLTGWGGGLALGVDPGPADVVGITVENNRFESNGLQVLDMTAELDLEAVLANNTFDRAVVVRGSSIKVPAIFSKIQDAIDAAEENDTIEVDPGLYAEIVTLNKHGITVRSTGGRDVTTIRGGTIRFDNAVIGVTLEGFTIDSTASLRAVETRMSGSTTIRDNRFMGSAPHAIAGAGLGGVPRPVDPVQFNILITGNIFDGMGITKTAHTRNLAITENEFFDSSLDIEWVGATITTISGNIFTTDEVNFRGLTDKRYVDQDSVVVAPNIEDFMALNTFANGNFVKRWHGETGNEAGWAVLLNPTNIEKDEDVDVSGTYTIRSGVVMTVKGSFGAGRLIIEDGGELHVIEGTLNLGTGNGNSHVLAGTFVIYNSFGSVYFYGDTEFSGDALTLISDIHVAPDVTLTVSGSLRIDGCTVGSTVPGDRFNIVVTETGFFSMIRTTISDANITLAGDAAEIRDNFMNAITITVEGDENRVFHNVFEDENVEFVDNGDATVTVVDDWGNVPSLDDTANNLAVFLTQDGLGPFRTLDDGNLFIQPGDVVEIGLDVSALQRNILGVEAMLGFNTDYFTAGGLSSVATVEPWDTLFLEAFSDDGVYGKLDTQVGLSFDVTDGKISDSLVAVISLESLSDADDGITQFYFRSWIPGDMDGLDTRLTGANPVSYLTPFTLNAGYITVDSTPPSIANLTATQIQDTVPIDMFDVESFARQGTVVFTVDAYDATAGIADSDVMLSVTNVADGAGASGILVETEAITVDDETWTRYVFEVVFDTEAPAGLYEVDVFAIDRSGNFSDILIDEFEFDRRLDVTVAMQGAEPFDYDREVTFKATDADGVVLETWVALVEFTNGVGESTLTDVPVGMVRLSAKTDVSLRRRIEAELDAEGQTLASFTDTNKLLGGDLTGDNAVNMLDYGTLFNNWLVENDPTADISGSGIVNMVDFEILKANFMSFGDPE